MVFICGDTSGSGKTTFCLSLIGSLLKSGKYTSNDIGYIKPCTQCQDVSLTSKYCESKGVKHRGLGPILFYQGFTQECIEGKDEGVKARHQKIKDAVAEVSKGKKFVLVDGVGYPAVGSVAGVSNGEVAALLGIPVILIGRSGVGNAIDSTNSHLSYIESFGNKVIGCLFNKLSDQNCYHSYDECKSLVSQYFSSHRPSLSIYGFVPIHQQSLTIEETEKKKGKRC
jgi:dethiobiotin synthetase